MNSGGSRPSLFSSPHEYFESVRQSGLVARLTDTAALQVLHAELGREGGGGAERNVPQ